MCQLNTYSNEFVLYESFHLKKLRIFRKFKLIPITIKLCFFKEKKMSLSFWIEGVCIPTVSCFGLAGQWKKYFLKV